MSAKNFCTTHKVYPPHYLFIFVKQETLGAELNHFTCYRLGTMLYLDIQKEKELEKT